MINSLASIIYLCMCTYVSRLPSLLTLLLKIGPLANRFATQRDGTCMSVSERIDHNNKGSAADDPLSAAKILVLSN